jgi:hypothetical protein
VNDFDDGLGLRDVRLIFDLSAIPLVSRRSSRGIGDHVAPRLHRLFDRLYVVGRDWPAALRQQRDAVSRDHRGRQQSLRATALKPNTTLALYGDNLLDKDPPLYLAGGGIVGDAYDGTRANPIGRLIAVSVTKNF